MRPLHGAAKLRLLFLVGDQLPHARGSRSLTRRREDESARVRVSVWWDFENCHVPAGLDSCRIAGTIADAVRANGIRGPIEITAFGDILLLSRSRQEGLTATGINLSHVPGGTKNGADRSLLLSLMLWVSQNPPPAHLLLISSDTYFANTLHRLRMNNYNILLAADGNASGILSSAASIVWNWADLVKGENLAGKCFNQPPDGPHGSWYGQLKGPLLDPYSNSEKSKLLSPPNSIPKPVVKKVEKIEASSDSQCEESCPKPGPIPKAVVKAIQKILESYPEGISSTLLWQELNATLKLDKAYYGYHRFLPFLSALSNILKIRNDNHNGNFTIHCVHRYNCSEPETSSGTEKGICCNYEDRVVLPPSTPPLSKFLENLSSEKIPRTSGPDESAIELADKSNGRLPSTDEKTAGKFITPESSESNLSIDGNIVETVRTPESESPVISVEERDGPPVVGFFRRFWRKLFPSEGSELENRDENEINDEEHRDRTCAKDESSVDSKPVDPAFPDRVQNFCRVHNPSNPKSPIDEEAGTGIFLKDSFWISVESFLNTSQGSVLVSESTTREKMANGLRSKGPESLRFLGETNTLRLVDLLISEKKWIEESTSENFPFKLAQDRSGLNNSSTVSHGSPSPPKRSRDEVLAACQTLVNEILKEHPGGFFIGLFRKLFLERYGYHIDLHQLGFPKLVKLLRTMSGLKIESGYILPGNDNTKNTATTENSSASEKHLSLDSAWEELGPVASEISAESNNPGSEMEKSVEKDTEFEFEPAISDDELSDSAETSNSGGKRSKARGFDESGGSLLQILDSWQNTGNGGENPKLEPLNTESVPKMTTVTSPRPSLSDTMRQIPARKKQRATKTVSFVADSGNDENDNKIVDNILGNLRKPVNESRKKENDAIFCN